MSDWTHAEQATVAAAVRDPGFRATVLDAGAEVFVHAESQRAWRILQEMTRNGHVVDAHAMEVALGEPLTATPSTDYWPILLEQRLQRQLQLLGRWLNKPRDGVSAKALAARALQSLNQALTATHHGAILSGAEASQAGLQKLALGDPKWLTSGVPVWDAATAGWGPEDFVLLGGRPSQGKTALGLQWAWQTAAQGRGTAFCSVEMGGDAIGMRAVAQRAQCSLSELKHRLADPLTAQAVHDLSAWPWYVMDASGASVPDLQAAVARADLLGPRCDVVIVDYLQLLQPSAKVASREQEITRIAADLKNWARRDRRLIIALTQLSRKVEDRTDRVPTLADLRESGALEQAADAVVLIHHAVDSDAVDFLVAKNRNGPTGSVPVRWHGKTMQFLARGF